MRPRLRSRLSGSPCSTAEPRPVATQSKIESRVLRDTAGGKEASFVINLKDQADLSAAYGMKNQRCPRLVRLQDAQEASRPHAGADQGDACLARRRLPVVLGRKRDHGHGRPLARQCSRCSVRREVDRVERQGRTGSRASTNPAPRKRSTRPTRSSPASTRCTLPTCGRSATRAKGSSSPTRTPACAGRTTRSSRITGAGTARPPDHNYNWHDSIHSGGGICSPNHHGALRRPLSRNAHDRHHLR